MAEIHLLGISSIINKEENINYSTILSPTRTLVIPVSFRYTAIHNLYLPGFVCDADAFPAITSGDHGNEPSVLEKYQLDFWCRLVWRKNLWQTDLPGIPTGIGRGDMLFSLCNIYVTNT